MAQPSQFVLTHVAGMSIKAGVTYATADILATYTDANILIMKTDSTIPITVSISGTDAFEIEFNETTYIETGLTYVFNQDCVVAIAKYVATP